MERKIIKGFGWIAFVLIILILPGCGMIENTKVKLGLKNEDFEYFKEGSVETITIQSVRDPDFKFIITDEGVIGDIYDILSKGKKADKKSELEPDYVIEIVDKAGDTYTYDYIAGLDKNDSGNLFSDDKVYIVSKRLDEELIANFFNVRKPINFYSVYYGSILSVVDEFIKDGSHENLDIRIKDDKYVRKFIYSTDVMNFKQYLKAQYRGVTLDSNEDADTVVDVVTKGYDSNTFKALCTVKNYDKEIDYYVVSEYKELGWDIKVYKDKAPEGF